MLAIYRKSAKQICLSNIYAEFVFGNGPPLMPCVCVCVTFCINICSRVAKILKMIKKNHQYRFKHLQSIGASLVIIFIFKIKLVAFSLICEYLVNGTICPFNWYIYI